MPSELFMLPEFLQKKIEFVNQMNTIIPDISPNVLNLRYEIYAGVSYQEFLVVEFVGGAISVRNCNGTSPCGILKDISELIDGGHYEQVDWYLKSFKTNSDWKLVH